MLGGERHLLTSIVLAAVPRAAAEEQYSALRLSGQ